MDTLQWASVKEEGLNHDYYIFFRVFRAFRGLNDFYYSCPFVSISGSIIPPFVLFVVPNLNGRTVELPCGCAHARHPRTTFYPLLPLPYFRGSIALILFGTGRFRFVSRSLMLNQQTPDSINYWSQCLVWLRNSLQCLIGRNADRL